MSTIKTFQIAKSTNYLAKFRAKGYYDKKIIVSYNADNPGLMEDMVVYDGLKAQYRTGHNTVSQLLMSGTVLPYAWDYLNYLFNNHYCLMKKGPLYKNLAFQSSTYYMDIFGCAITENNQCTLTNGASATFNSSKVIPEQASTVKMIFKMTLTNTTTSQVITRINSGVKQAQSYVQSSGYYKGYFGGAIGGVTSLVANTTYWFGVYEDNLTIKGYLLADNGTYTLDTLPDFSEWSEEWSQNVTSKYTYKGCSIGFFKLADAQPWLGSIDLNNCKIWADNEDFWYYGMNDDITDTENKYLGVFDTDYADDGMAKTYNIFANGNTDITFTTDEIRGTDTWLGSYEIPAHDLYSYSETQQNVYDNFLVVGNGVSVEQETGNASGFSTSSYLDTGYFPQTLPKVPWKMRVCFKYSANSTQYYLCAGFYTNGPTILSSQTNKLECFITSAGSVIGSISGTKTLENGVNYKAEIVFDGIRTYTLRLQKKGENWETAGSLDYDGAVVFGEPLIIGGNKSSYYCRGIIDLSTDTYFEINGVKTWMPTTIHYTGSWEKL